MSQLLWIDLLLHLIQLGIEEVQLIMNLSEFTFNFGIQVINFYFQGLSPLLQVFLN